MDRGNIMLIGGAEDSVPNIPVLQAFLEISGGAQADLILFATASRFEREPHLYLEALAEAGATKVRLIYIDKRSDGENAEYLQALDSARGVLLMGGNHLRLTSNLGGTTLARKLRRRNAEGMAVAGTAAGAAYICAHMITYGQIGASPKAGRVSLTPGLGLLNSIIVDPQIHRQGLGRLMTSLAYNPFAIGIGLEEGGAVLIGSDYEVRALGLNAANLLDPSELEHNTIDEAKNEESIGMIGLKLHILTPGMSYNLKTHQATIGDRLSDRNVGSSKNWHA